MWNSTHRWPRSRHFFPKLGPFFPIFEKRHRIPLPPPLPTLVAHLNPIVLLAFRTQTRMFIKSPLESSYTDALSGVFTWKNNNLLTVVFSSFIFQILFLFFLFLGNVEISVQNALSMFSLYLQNYIGWTIKVLTIKEQNVPNNLVNQFRYLRRCIRLEIFYRLNVQNNEFAFSDIFNAFVLLHCTINEVFH